MKSAKVSKTLLPHHSAPRLGSVCPNTGLNPWAAVMGHPWPRTANPASCRVTHGFKPEFGQRGLTGRLRSRSRAEQDQERLASHRGYLGRHIRYLCRLNGRHRRQASSHTWSPGCLGDRHRLAGCHGGQRRTGVVQISMTLASQAAPDSSLCKSKRTSATGHSLI